MCFLTPRPSCSIAQMQDTTTTLQSIDFWFSLSVLLFFLSIISIFTLIVTNICHSFTLLSFSPLIQTHSDHITVQSAVILVTHCSSTHAFTPLYFAAISSRFAVNQMSVRHFLPSDIKERPIKTLLWMSVRCAFVPRDECPLHPANDPALPLRHTSEGTSVTTAVALPPFPSAW